MTPTQVDFRRDHDTLEIRQIGRFGGTTLACGVLSVLSVTTLLNGGKWEVLVLLLSSAVLTGWLGKPPVRQTRFHRTANRWTSAPGSPELESLSLHWEGTLSPRLILSAHDQAGQTLPLLRCRRPEPLLRWATKLVELTQLPLDIEAARLPSGADNGERPQLEQQLYLNYSNAGPRAGLGLMIVLICIFFVLTAITQIQLSKIGSTPWFSWLLYSSVPMSGVFLLLLLRHRSLRVQFGSEVVIEKRPLPTALGRWLTDWLSPGRRQGPMRLRINPSTIQDVVCIGHPGASSSALWLKIQSANPEHQDSDPLIFTVDRNNAPRLKEQILEHLS